MHRPVGLALLHKPTAAEAPHGFIHLQRRYKHPARRKRPKRWEPPRTKPLDIERKIKNPILHDQRMGSVETLMEGESSRPSHGSSCFPPPRLIRGSIFARIATFYC